jgi:hypothetical protein
VGVVVAYKVIWSVVCSALAVVGVAVACILSPAAAAFVFSTFAVVGAIVTRFVVKDYRTRSLRRRTTSMAMGALVSASSACGFVGLGVAFGPGVFLLGLFLVGGSPMVVGAYTRWLDSTPSASGGRLDGLARAFAFAAPGYLPIQPVCELRELTDDQLCQAWRASTVSLREHPSGEELTRTVEQRQAVLDELERRNPGGLTTWLASGARAAGDPRPYLSKGHLECRGIDWDELTRGR